MQPWSLGGGVTLTIANLRDSASGPHSGVISMRVTLTNDGTQRIRVGYRDFSLSGSAQQRYLALLPTEISPRRPPADLLPEGILERDQEISGVLLFRAVGAQSLDLRVDLESADQSPISRSFLPLHFFRSVG